MKNRLLAAALSATVMLSAFTVVDASAADNVTSLTSKHLAEILAASGFTKFEFSKPKDGVEVVSFNDGEGVNDFVLSDCTADGCQTLQMTMVFGKDDHFTLASINAYNSKVMNAQAALLTSGNVVLLRLFVTNGGVSDGNIKSNVAIFFQAPKMLADVVTTQVTASRAQDNPVRTVASTGATSVEMGLATQSVPMRNLDVLQLLAAAKPERAVHRLR